MAESVECTTPRLMTPREVLSVLNGFVALWSAGNSRRDAEPFTFDTTLEEWSSRLSRDGFDVLDIAFQLESLFDVRFEIQVFQEWFTEDDAPTLKHLCEYIAQRAEAPQIESLQIAGMESYEAGLFLAMKREIERLGMDTTELRPSTDVDRYLMTRSDALLLALLRLNGGRLPEVECVRHPLTRAGAAMCLREGICLLIAGAIAAASGAMDVLVTSVLGLAFAIASLVLGEQLCPTHLGFAQTLTFRELCEWMADGGLSTFDGVDA